MTETCRIGADTQSVKRVNFALKAVRLLAEAHEPIIRHEIGQLGRPKKNHEPVPRILFFLAELAEHACDKALGSEPKKPLSFEKVPDFGTQVRE